MSSGRDALDPGGIGTIFGGGASSNLPTAGQPLGIGWGDLILAGGQAALQAWIASRNEGGAVMVAPTSLPGGSTGTGIDPNTGAPPGVQGPMNRPNGNGGGGLMGGTGIFPARGLYHTTRCGNTAANGLVMETGPKGEVFMGFVKRISIAKLKRSLLAQVRSTGRSHTHRHRHPRRR